ncbi:uncharacterized protein LOC122954136 [Acropora millepora]|uniref:uncharacterized protein LOC122954136 n=1 Tax=Acropora millepora TaxID=45264 RepID=UPI001CF39029|nr:uncharacterized protein LOC122954136 [Acropora millepora]
MRKQECIIFFQVLLGFSVIYDAESQVTITSQPVSPLRVLERQSLTLEWSFSVVRPFLRVEVAVSGSRLAIVEASLGERMLFEECSLVVLVQALHKQMQRSLSFP